MEKKFETKDSMKSICELQKDEYIEILKKYGVSLEQTEICDLAEFLLTEHNEKYEKNRAIYETDEDLKKIYAIVDRAKEIAVFINVNENGKIPKGEFGVYDFKNHKFDASDFIKEKIEKTVRKMTNGTFTEKEVDAMIKNISPKTLDDIDKIATKENEIYEKIKLQINQNLNEKNNQNGKSFSEREKNSKENSRNIKVQNEDEKRELPKDVKLLCEKLHVITIKSYFYVNASEISDKVDGTKVNKNGNKVLILEIPDTMNANGTNKYYGMQDNRLVIYGTENKEIRDVTGNVTKMGKTINPLKLQNDEYIKYQDSQGLIVNEKIDDKADLSVQDIENYKKEMEEILEKYSQDIYKIKYESELLPDEKINKIQEIDGWYDEQTIKITKQNNVSIEDNKNIDLTTEEHIEDIQEEIKDDAHEDIETWEVPGKRKIEK